MVFSPLVFLLLAAGCGVMMILEFRGLPTTLALTFKGDIKRESRWLAQYGQAVCTFVAGMLVWQLDAGRRGLVYPVLLAPLAGSLSCMLLKRLLSRVRPGRENAGKFLGPSWKHANYKESFPSSHSACAMALSVTLARIYPQAALSFFLLAGICAALRYFLDAHWPSDVLGGLALGYGIAHAVWWGFAHYSHVRPA
jgi:membrane-associated phospholipid phosphatase